MSPPDEEYSQADLKRIRNALSDETATQLELTVAITREVATGGTFLPKFLNVLNQITSVDFFPALPLLNVICERGDEILLQGKAEPSLHWWNGREDVCGLVRRCLLQIPEEDRAVALRVALSNAGLSTRAVILAAQFQPHNMELAEEVRGRMDESAITASEASTLSEAFIEEVATAPEAVLTTPVGWQVILLWNSVRGPQQIKIWIEANLNRPQLVVFLIDMVMSRVSSTSGEYRELRGPIAWKFLDLSKVVDAAKGFASSGQIPDQEIDLVNSFIRDASDRLTTNAHKKAESPINVSGEL